MRKHLFTLLALLASVVVFAQKSSDPELNKRISEYMRLTEQLKFDEVMDYTHPKIFTIAPREQLVEIFKTSFDNESMKISFDSTGIISISEPFKLESASYRRIDYWMAINITFKDTSALADESFVSNMKTSLANGFPGAKIEYNKATKKFEINTSTLMIAIKDDAQKPWMFLGYQKNDNGLSKMLYPQEVLDHFKLQ